MTESELRIYRRWNALAFLAAPFCCIILYAMIWDQPPAPYWLVLGSQIVVLVCGLAIAPLSRKAKLSSYDHLLGQSQSLQVKRFRFWTIAAVWIAVFCLGALLALAQFSDAHATIHRNAALTLAALAAASYALGLWLKIQEWRIFAIIFARDS